MSSIFIVFLARGNPHVKFGCLIDVNNFLKLKMNKLFGVSKKKEEPKSNPNAPTLTETSEKLDDRGKVVNAKLEACNKEL